MPIKQRVELKKLRTNYKVLTITGTGVVRAEVGEILGAGLVDIVCQFDDRLELIVDGIHINSAD